MKIFVVILTWLSIAFICETTLLWRINIDPPAYLLGTVHLPYESIWPSISDEAKAAFYNSTHFLPEFDMTNLFSFTRLRGCMSKFIPPKAKNLLSKLYMSKSGGPESILDIYLTHQARRMYKVVSSLESVEIYCEFSKFQLDSLLSNLTSMPSSGIGEDEKEIMKQAYNCDLNSPDELFPMSTPFLFDEKIAQFQQRLQDIVRRRDTKMTQLIDSLLKEGSSTNRYFFATGFIHLMGADGIVARLRRDYKYSVTRLCTDPEGFRSTLGCQGPSWCDANNRN